MKKVFIALFSLLFLAACAPSSTSTLKAAQASWTVAPTYTFYPTFTPYPTYTLVITNTPSPSASNTEANAVIVAFKAAGLEAENIRPMTTSDYGMAPYVCQGTRFFIPSLGSDNGGRLFICDKQSDQDALAKYYQDLGNSGTIFFSWVFQKGNILVQINGDLPDTTAHKYEAAIP